MRIHGIENWGDYFWSKYWCRQGLLTQEEERGGMEKKRDRADLVIEDIM